MAKAKAARKPKYLILGSRGQIGSAMVEVLKRGGKAEVIEFDIVNSPRQDLRLAENKFLRQAMQKADFVFFLAFDVGGSRYLKSYQNTYNFVTNNLKIMVNTFEMLKAYNKPFIFASSQMSNMSYSNYGRLKAMGETYTKLLGGLVVKFWNVYGLETNLEKSHVITDLIIKAAKSKRIDLLTDGTEQRQFLYADDCCECLLELAIRYRQIPRDQELHITNFKWHSILDVAKIIAKSFPGSTIKPAKAIDEVQQDKRNEPDRYILKFWRPKTSLAAGIKHIISGMEQKRLI